MAKLIRCIEGHVFESTEEKCPICGWIAGTAVYDNDVEPKAGAAQRHSIFIIPLLFGFVGATAVAGGLYFVFMRSPAPPKSADEAQFSRQETTAPARKIEAAPTQTPVPQVTSPAPAPRRPANPLLAINADDPNTWPVGTNSAVIKIRITVKKNDPSILLGPIEMIPEPCSTGWITTNVFAKTEAINRVTSYDACIRTQERGLGEIIYRGNAEFLREPQEGFVVRSNGSTNRLSDAGSSLQRLLRGVPDIQEPRIMQLIEKHDASENCTGELRGSIRFHRALFEFRPNNPGSKGWCLDTIPTLRDYPFVFIRTNAENNCNSEGDFPLADNKLCLIWPKEIGENPEFEMMGWPLVRERFIKRITSSNDPTPMILQARRSDETFRAPELGGPGGNIPQTGACLPDARFEGFSYCLIEP